MLWRRDGEKGEKETTEKGTSSNNGGYAKNRKKQNYINMNISKLE